MKEDGQSPQEGQETVYPLFDTEKDPINPVLILAETLVERGYSIQVVEEPIDSSKMALFAEGKKAKEVFRTIIRAPEIVSLSSVFQGGDLSSSILHMANDRILFSPQVIRKLEAFRLARMAAKLRLMNGGDEHPLAVKAEEMAKKQLEQGPFDEALAPLDVSDMKSLVEKVVDRELASYVENTSAEGLEEVSVDPNLGPTEVALAHGRMLAIFAGNLLDKPVLPGQGIKTLSDGTKIVVNHYLDGVNDSRGFRYFDDNISVHVSKSGGGGIQFHITQNGLVEVGVWDRRDKSNIVSLRSHLFPTPGENNKVKYQGEEGTPREAFVKAACPLVDWLDSIIKLDRFKESPVSIVKKSIASRLLGSSRASE